jgi:hypothetical protein
MNFKNVTRSGNGAYARKEIISKVIVASTTWQHESRKLWIFTDGCSNSKVRSFLPQGSISLGNYGYSLMVASNSKVRSFLPQGSMSLGNHGYSLMVASRRKVRSFFYHMTASVSEIMDIH